MKIDMGLLLKYKAIFLVLFIAFLGVVNLLHPGLPPTHDGEYHVIRFYEFDKTLRSGSLFPVWAQDLNNGYGVPLFNYVYPFPNYFASFLHIFGFSFIDAVRLNMFFASLLSAVFMYLWAKRYWGTLGGIVSSVFYSFSPYHFLDVYIRGSVGEVWALAFAPALLWTATEFIATKKQRYLLSSSIFLALLIYSHNILAAMFFPFFITYFLFLIYKNKNWKFYVINLFIITLLGLSLSAPFWFPAIFEMKYVRGLQIFDPLSNFPQLYQLILPSWGSGFSGADVYNQMSFQIGAANLFVVFLLLSFFIANRKIKYEYKNIIIFFLFFFTGIFFIMLEISSPIWKTFPVLGFFQFPWRFLSLEILICAFLSGSVFKILFSNSSPNKKILIGVVMILGCVLLSIRYAKAPYYHARDDMYYVTKSNFIDGTNSIGNVFNTAWMNAALGKKTSLGFFPAGGRILNSENSPERWKLDVESNESGIFIASLAYFPGWAALVDGKVVDVTHDDNGLIKLFVPKGVHKIEIYLQNTNIRLVSKIIGGIGIVFGLGFILSSLFAKLFNRKNITMPKSS